MESPCECGIKPPDSISHGVSIINKMHSHTYWMLEVTTRMREKGIISMELMGREGFKRKEENFRHKKMHKFDTIYINKIWIEGERISMIILIK